MTDTSQVTEELPVEMINLGNMTLEKNLSDTANIKYDIESNLKNPTAHSRNSFLDVTNYSENSCNDRKFDDPTEDDVDALHPVKLLNEKLGQLEFQIDQTNEKNVLHFVAKIFVNEKEFISDVCKSKKEAKKDVAVKILK